MLLILAELVGHGIIVESMGCGTVDFVVISIVIHLACFMFMDDVFEMANGSGVWDEIQRQPLLGRCIVTLRQNLTLGLCRYPKIRLRPAQAERSALIASVDYVSTHGMGGK